MQNRIRLTGAAAGAACVLALAACVPLFTAGIFQTLTLGFRLERALPEGEETVVHVAVFPDGVKVRKNWVKVSGRLEADGGELPESVTLRAEVARPGDGRVAQRITARLAVGDDGRFEARAKIKKDIGANDMLTLVLRPNGADLAEGTAVTLCVDVVRRRPDLARVPECVPEPDDGDDDPEGTTLSSLQADILTPSCTRVGCHDAAGGSGGLVLVAGASFGNLVNVPSQQRPDLNRVTPNDPDNSYLIKKLRGDPDIVGGRMPRGGPALTDEQIARFVGWINRGAPND